MAPCVFKIWRLSLFSSAGSFVRCLSPSLPRSLVSLLARSLARSLAPSLPRFLVPSLPRSRSLDPSLAHPLVRSLARFLAPSFPRSPDRSFTSCLAWSPVRSLDCSFARSLLRSPGRSFVPLALAPSLSPSEAYGWLSMYLTAGCAVRYNKCSQKGSPSEPKSLKRIVRVQVSLNIHRYHAMDSKLTPRYPQISWHGFQTDPPN